MNSHQLSIDIPEIINDCVLHIIDTSSYMQYVTPECPTLQIQVPGFTDIVTIEVQPGFNLSLTACDLEIQLHNCDNLRNSLPDGVYVIRYSLSPNEDFYVEYNHLRTVNLEKRIYDLLCCLDLSACVPMGEEKAKLDSIHTLTVMLKAAKANVEFCHFPTKGINMYNFVNKEIKKLACHCGCASC